MEVEEYGYIYAIGYEGEVKIGKSAYDPNKRLTQMQSGNSRLLELVGCAYVQGYHEIERILHKELKNQGTWIRGEWYRLTLEKAQAVIKGVGEDLISKIKAEKIREQELWEEYRNRLFG